MSNSKSCSGCGLAIAAESHLSLCPSCLRSTGHNAADATDRSATKQKLEFDPTVDYVSNASSSEANFIVTQPASQFAALSGWEQAQIVELGQRGYTVQRKLGDGGFGVVFLATDAAERTVAVKMLHAGLCQDRYRQRFALEANALTRLDDPALVRLYHFDVSGADPMLVTEFVPGGTLAKRLQSQGVFAPAEAAETILQLATVVHKVHEAGLVHRDIKPSNILIDAAGRMKLGDFGLAKRLDRDDELTPTGRGIGGTPEYSAPEQFRSSGDCDGRADIYALGATLYRLLTGRPVFERRNDADFVAVILRVLSEEPLPPRKLVPTIPRELEAVCLKCLAKNPTDRYRTAADLAADLKAWQVGAEMQARPSSLAARAWRSLRAAPKFPVALALMVVLGLAAAFIILRKDEPQPTPDIAAVMRQELESQGQVDLLDDKGWPRWHRWVVGSPEIAGGLAGGIGFEAMDASVVELYPNAPEHFVLRGKLRFVTTRFGQGVGESPYIGFFIGGQQSVAADDKSVTAYSLAGLNFQDGPRANPKGRMDFELSHFVHREGVLMPRKSRNLGLLNFVPAAGVPGPWREFEIEVTAEQVKPSLILGDHKQPLLPSTKQTIDAKVIAAELAVQQRRLNQEPAVAGLKLPPWNSRGAVGIFGYKAAVEFGGVSMQILP